MGFVKFPDDCETDEEKIVHMRAQEPLDYLNLVKTYTMFLQHISVLSSSTLNDSYVNEEQDKNF